MVGSASCGASFGGSRPSQAFAATFLTGPAVGDACLLVGGAASHDIAAVAGGFPLDLDLAGIASGQLKTCACESKIGNMTTTPHEQQRNSGSSSRCTSNGSSMQAAGASVRNGTATETVSAAAKTTAGTTTSEGHTCSNGSCLLRSPLLLLSPLLLVRLPQLLVPQVPKVAAAGAAAAAAAAALPLLPLLLPLPWVSPCSC
ncbi:MAG: hypothetical protein EBV06_12310 [Planctomycetia bacterium]|nr:hypothetical protein [Planctomycetia bacterium]